jgi:hypothetical protein
MFHAATSSIMSSKKPDYDRTAFGSWLALRCEQEGLPAPNHQPLPRRFARWLESEWPVISQLPEARGVSIGKDCDSRCIGPLFEIRVSVQEEEFTANLVAPLQFEPKKGVEFFVETLRNTEVVRAASEAAHKPLEFLKANAERESDTDYATGKLIGVALLFGEIEDSQPPMSVREFLDLTAMQVGLHHLTTPDPSGESVISGSLATLADIDISGSPATFEDNDIEFAMARSLRQDRRFADDPYIDTAFKLADLIASQDCMACVHIDGHTRTFSRKDASCLPLFCIQLHENLIKKNGLLLRRVEPGPQDPISNLPYETIGAASYDPRTKRWFSITKPLTHLTDDETGKKIPVETSVVFSTIPEMFPGLLSE